MRHYRVIFALALAACSGKETADPKNAGSAGTGSGSEGGAGESSGGSAGSSGGSSGSSGSGSGATSGASATGGSGGTSGSAAVGGAGGEEDLVSCDHRQVLCKSIEPTCPEMQVARVDNGCWGPCVEIELCACGSAEECPHEETYTCWSQQHCGPYVR